MDRACTQGSLKTTQHFKILYNRPVRAIRVVLRGPGVVETEANDREPALGEI